LKREIGRDMENLLNSRRRCKPGPSLYRELNDSVSDYGIPDFTGLNMSLRTEREKARLEIERVISRFEPRLKNVTVTVQGNVDESDRTLRLRITGVLRTSPQEERVAFDSKVQPSTRVIEVKAAS
jgi:type VI secretion system protein ImpF